MIHPFQFLLWTHSHSRLLITKLLTAEHEVPKKMQIPTGTVWRILKGSSPPHPKWSATAFSRWVYARRSHKHFPSSNTPEAETCFFILYLSYLVLKYQELGCFIEYYYHRAVKWAFSYCSASHIKWKAFKIKFYYQYWPALNLLASSWNNGSNAWKKYALE